MGFRVQSILRLSDVKPPCKLKAWLFCQASFWVKSYQSFGAQARDMAPHSVWLLAQLSPVCFMHSMLLTSFCDHVHFLAGLSDEQTAASAALLPRT